MYTSQEEILGAAYAGPVAGSPLIPPEVVTVYFFIFLALLTIAFFVLHQHIKPVHIRHKLKLLLLTAVVLKIFLIAGGALLGGYWLIPRPNIFILTPKAEESKYPVAQKIEIIFDRPINRQLLEKTISPEVPGVWVFENSLYTTHLYRKLVFYPTVTLKTNTIYTVTLSNIQNILQFSSPYNYSFSFKTQETPHILSVSPKSGTEKVAIDSGIQVKLTESNEKISQFDFELSPPHPFTINFNTTEKTYTLKPKNPLQQGVNYQLKVKKTGLIWNIPANTIFERGITTLEYEGSFTTKEAPGIENFSPEGKNNLLNTQVNIVFSQAMDRKSVEEGFSIQPTVTGTFGWTDDRTVTFTPTRLDSETAYTVKIAKGARAKSTGFVEPEISKTFSTIGRVKVEKFSPENGWSAVAVNNIIKITFDQEVDKNSAQSKFSISPNVAGTFSWEETTMVFTPTSNFPYSQSYKVIISPGIKSISGQNSTGQFTTAFTTQEQTVKLATPAYLQKFTLSCEIAALRMALAYKKHDISEEKLLEQIGVDPTPHNGNVWGNPHVAFVGNVNGTQMADGYGVHWEPIGRVARIYQPSSKEFTGWSINQLTESITQDSPVVIWTYSSGGWPTTWQTPDGQTIHAYRDEHAVTAVGFVGPADNPSQIIINDPLIGQVYWPRSFFDRKWSSFNRSGVAVY